MINKNKINIFKYAFMILLFSFTTLYIASYNGYYDYTNHKKVILTNEKIKEFEQDILDGKEIDIKDYIVKVENNDKRLGLKISLFIEEKTNNLIKKTFKLLSKMIEK